MANKSPTLSTSYVPQGTEGVMLAATGSAITGSEKSQALAAAGLDDSYLSTDAPVWAVPVAAGIVVFSAIVAYKLVQGR
jgi:hypothetical protein